MSATNTRTARGHITLVQEQRFRLQTDDGPSYLFTLARNAPLDQTDLCRLRDASTRVVVEYEGEPGLASGIAHHVRPSS